MRKKYGEAGEDRGGVVTLLDLENRQFGEVVEVMRKLVEEFGKVKDVDFWLKRSSPTAGLPTTPAT